MNPNKRYKAAFYDILPSAPVQTELPPFPGAIKLGDVRAGQRLKVINNPTEGGFSWNREAVFTVTDAPFKDRRGDFHLEIVFDRHVLAEHPNIRPNDYKSCCFQDVRAADLGLTSYSDRHWNQDNYCIEYREED